MIIFLNKKHQRFDVNGQSWSWSQIKAGATHRSALGTLLNLVFINYLPAGFA